MAALPLRSLLDRLPAGWGTSAKADLAALTITGLAEDSRRAEAGTFFVAHRGRDADGHRYIAAALRGGAVAVAGELPPEELPAPLPAGVPYWRVADGREAFALLSAAFFNYPSRRFPVVGVTGTDGKTTTSTLLNSILDAAGMRPGLITTLAAHIGSETLDTGLHVTTPEAFDLQSYLAQMEAKGCGVAVLESTSHALDQRRVAYVEYDVAVLTNITHEHLDWHGTWENYVAAKARLFQTLATSARKPGVAKSAVLNRDDASFDRLRALVHERVLTYSLTQQADCTAHDLALERSGTRFVLRTPVGEQPVHLRLLGRHNVANALAAAGAALALEVPLAEIVAGLEAVDRVLGRAERAYAGEFDVLVDFAHTPNSLRQTLALARGLVSPGGRVLVVFGSAGLRDVGKRRMMGEIAAAADFAVLTADDPRTERVEDILDEIAGGLTAAGREEGRDFVRIPDRAAALTAAIARAEPGDVVLACGKAHERSMSIGTTEVPWDEFAAVRAALAARGL